MELFGDVAAAFHSLVRPKIWGLSKRYKNVGPIRFKAEILVKNVKALAFFKIFSIIWKRKKLVLHIDEALLTLTYVQMGLVETGIVLVKGRRSGFKIPENPQNFSNSLTNALIKAMIKRYASATWIDKIF